MYVNPKIYILPRVHNTVLDLFLLTWSTIGVHLTMLGLCMEVCRLELSYMYGIFVNVRLGLI